MAPFFMVRVMRQGNGPEADPPSADIADGWAESFPYIICCYIKALTELFVVVTLNP
jgi:hypothetical protein